MPEEVIVDPRTGNVLVVHRRSIGIGSTLFFVALVCFIIANYLEDVELSQGFYTFGSLCCLLLPIVLIWRCCLCCCASNTGPSYLVVTTETANGVTTARAHGRTTTTFAHPQSAVPIIPAAYPTQQPMGSTAYPTQQSMGPAYTAGVQPAFNPNYSAPPMEAPPSYADATGVPLTMKQ